MPKSWWVLFIFLCPGVEDMWCVVNTIVSWLWRCQEERRRAATWTVSSGLSSISCLGALNIQCFCLLDDMMAGKRFYMTASVAREHINKLWENEGTTLNKTKQDVRGGTHVHLHACLEEELLSYILLLILFIGFFLKCLFSGVEEMPSQQGERCSDLFFLEMLVVPPCRCWLPANEDAMTHCFAMFQWEVLISTWSQSLFTVCSSSLDVGFLTDRVVHRVTFLTMDDWLSEEGLLITAHSWEWCRKNRWPRLWKLFMC